MREFKVIGEPRRVREDRRFVTGAARYVADIKLPGLVHTATVASPHPAAGIEAIDASNALAHPGVHAVVTGRELVDHIDPLMNGLDTPNVRRLPLAVDEVRYVGEWVVAVVADTRAIAEDAAELVRVDYAPRPHVIDAEVAYRSDSPAVHSLHGSNVLLDRTFTWGTSTRTSPPRPNSSPFARNGDAARPFRSKLSASSLPGIRGANGSKSGPRFRCLSSPISSPAHSGYRATVSASIRT